MLLRAITLASGLAGAGFFAQFPEYSHQYIQRLGGAVDALSTVVADFDRSAAREGRTRAQALAAMTSNSDDFVRRRGHDMTRTIDRARVLAEDLATVQNASAFQRVIQAPRFVDAEIAGKALENFEPAIPINIEGLSFAGAGFAFGWGAFAAILSGLGLLFRRRSPPVRGPRPEPPLSA